MVLTQALQIPIMMVPMKIYSLLHDGFVLSLRMLKLAGIVSYTKSVSALTFPNDL